MNRQQPRFDSAMTGFVMNIVVHVSDARHSSDPADVITTYSLGSCIGVTLYDPVARIGGMLHFQLPSAAMDEDRARRQPLMFGDSGFAWLLEQLEHMGAVKRRMKVKLAGAAQILDDNGVFNIGRRNHAAIRKVLWQHGLLIDGEDIGGKSPRNLYLQIADGAVAVRKDGTQAPL